VQREFNRRVAELFQARGIQIANPQRTVFVESAGKRAGGKADDGAPSAGTPDAPDSPDTTGAAPPAEQRPGFEKPPTA
jgi:small-conductance mechanosensitive channel